METMNLNVLLQTLQYITSASEDDLAEWLDIDVATISRHINGKSGWRKSKDLRHRWNNAIDKCCACFKNSEDCCVKICEALSSKFKIDSKPYQQIFEHDGFAAFADAIVSDAWYEKSRDVNYPKSMPSVPITGNNNVSVPLEKQIAAIRAYSDVWTNIDRLFLKPQLLRLKPYFYELRHELPPEKDIDLGIAMSLRIRDGIQYAQGLLSFIPNGHRESHYDFQEQIMSAEITKLAMSCYRFEWEEYEHPIVDGSMISVESIVAFSKYWTDIGEAFLEGSNAHLRKYFFEAKDSLPDNENDIEAAKVIAEMYRDAMMYSELLLDTIPFEYRRSYNTFKRIISEAKIIQASREKNKFTYEKGLGF